MVWQLQKQDTVARDFTTHAPLVEMILGNPLPPVETEYDALDSLLRNIATDFGGQPMLGPGQTSEEWHRMMEQPANRAVPLVTIDGGEEFQPNRVFHNQMATELRIPYDYYKRQWLSHPEDLVKSMNSWLTDMETVNNVERPVHGRRTVRTMGNTARAFVSHKYRRLDNYPLMMACMQHLFDLGVTNDNVVSCNVTDQKMYIKVVTPKLEGEVKVGDLVQAGIEISNSEVGRGALAVKPLLFRLVCMNGSVMSERGLRKTHIGKSQMGDEDNGWEIYSDETMKLADQALFAEVGDVVKHTLSEEVFDLELDKARAAATQEVTAEPMKVVEKAASNLQFSEAEQTSILENFMGGEKTRWGMVNAITATSQDEDISYERASEMEKIGGQVLEDDNIWNGIVRFQ
jgi:hypothetical protein